MEVCLGSVVAGHATSSMVRVLCCPICYCQGRKQAPTQFSRNTLFRTLPPSSSSGPSAGMPVWSLRVGEILDLPSQISGFA